MQPIHYAAVLGAVLVLGVCVVRWTRSRGAGKEMANNRRLAAFALVIVGGVTLNAIVCGAFSGPWGRYQARVVWLIPMAAVLLLEHAVRGTERRAWWLGAVTGKATRVT